MFHSRRDLFAHHDGRAPFQDDPLSCGFDLGGVPRIARIRGVEGLHLDAGPSVEAAESDRLGSRTSLAQ